MTSKHPIFVAISNQERKRDANNARIVDKENPYLSKTQKKAAVERKRLDQAPEIAPYLKPPG